METNFSCSEDSFDAIYKCDCLKMLCPKHYFSHLDDFPNHQINRIKMNVNNESRQILTYLVIAGKQNIMECVNKVDFIKSHSKELCEYELISIINNDMHRLNLLLLFLVKTKYVFKKIFYTPFEYFLHQPTEKVANYASEFNFKDFFELNYFKFEDKRYIFSFEYLQAHDNFKLLSICEERIEHLFRCSEYEIAYETLQNYINIIEIAHPKDASFWLRFAEIVYNFIKTKNTIKLIKQWKKIEENLPNYYWLSFYRLSNALFKGLNEKDLVLYSLEKLQIFMQGYYYDAFNLYCLGILFFEGKNYKRANQYFIKCIRQYRNSSDIKDLNYVIYSCSMLAEDYLYRCKNQRKAKKIVNIFNKITESFGKSGGFDEALLRFYYAIHDWDNAHKIAWKLIKLYEKNQTNTLNYSKSHIYLTLADIYSYLGYDKKCIESLANAKSCAGILSIGSDLCKIYKKLGNAYYRNEQYKDAVYYYEYVFNYQKDKKKLTISKFYAGMAYFRMENYDRALQYFIEIKDDFLCFPWMHNNKLFEFYSCIGESYNCTNNKETANYYFCKAYELINYLEYADGFESIHIFKFFLDNKDFEKCQAILEIWLTWAEKFTDLSDRIMVFYQGLVLCLHLNRLGSAAIFWKKIKNISDIDKISLMPKKKLYENLSLLTIMAYANIYLIKDFIMGEKVLKFYESLLDSRKPCRAWRLNFVYENLLHIYVKQNRLVEIKIYGQKYLNFLNLADQNEIWWENISISKADIKEKIKNINNLLNA